MIQTDKIKHFSICMAAAVINPWLAIGLALGKEYGDKCASGNHWCWWDLLADALGTIAGTAIRSFIF